MCNMSTPAHRGTTGVPCRRLLVSDRMEQTRLLPADERTWEPLVSTATGKPLGLRRHLYSPSPRATE